MAICQQLWHVIRRIVRQYFEKRVNEGFDILHIAFSSALSSSYNNACIAANEVMEEHPGARIVVVDSLAASMGEGLIVYKAVEMKKSGKSMDEIIDFVNNHKLNVVHNFTVDDLNHFIQREVVFLRLLPLSVRLPTSSQSFM